MSILSNNKKDNKKGSKNAKSSVPGAKQTVKPGKGAAFAKKPIKTGGTRGS